MLNTLRGSIFCCFALISLPILLKAGDGSLLVLHKQALLDGGSRLRVDLYLSDAGDGTNFYVDFARSVLTDCPNDMRTLPVPSEEMFTRTYGSLPPKTWAHRAATFVSKEEIGTECRVRPYVEQQESTGEHWGVKSLDAKYGSATLKLEGEIAARDWSLSPVPGLFFSPALIEIPGGHARDSIANSIMFDQSSSKRSIEITGAEYVCSGQRKRSLRLKAKEASSLDGVSISSIHFFSDHGWPKAQGIGSCKIALAMNFRDGKGQLHVAKATIDLMGGGRFVAVGSLSGEHTPLKRAETVGP